MSAPKHFRDRDEIALVRAETEPLANGESAAAKRRLAGRVLGRRDMGKLVFLDLVDRSGRIQLLCHVERTGEIDVHLARLVPELAAVAEGIAAASRLLRFGLNSAAWESAQRRV